MSGVNINNVALLNIVSVKVSKEPFLLPFANVGIAAGFPSPAADHLESIDLKAHMIKNPFSTFFARVDGNSMQDAGIHDNDLLIIDKSLQPQDGDIVVCYYEGAWTVKQLQKKDGRLYLVPANPEYKPVLVTEEMNLTVFGVVTYSVTQHRKKF